MRTALFTLITAVFVTLTGTALAAEDGAKVFEEACASCHTGGIGGWMSGAPDMDDADDWEGVLEKGTEALTLATITGIGEMPPMGKCETCTEEQIGAAVEYMVEQLK
jgi:cytochrome c5